VTPLAVATATPHLPGGMVGALVILGVVWVIFYLIACAIWPWRSCPRCEGGKRRSPTRRAFRDCRRCGGRGRRLRLGGRRLWSAAELQMAAQVHAYRQSRHSEP
jgi:hypothetical protein